MAKLYDQKTGDLLLDLSAAQLQFLIDQLEEEDSKDQDYYIDRNTIAMMREAGGDPDLLGAIEKAIAAASAEGSPYRTSGDEEPSGIDVVWRDD